MTPPERPEVAELLRLLDIAVWGFPGEPRRCSRCNCDEGEPHSPTCPMPREVLGPLARLLQPVASRDERWDRYVDAQIEEIRKAAVG